MNELTVFSSDLIPVYETSEGHKVVIGRELHERLKNAERYSKWFDRMAGYGFERGIDYTPYQMVHPQNHQEIFDYMMKLDMAKEAAMVSRLPMGKQARQYFIQLEKDWNSPEKTMARALLLADKKIKEQAAKIEADKPKVLFAESVAVSKGTMLVRELAKLITQNGYEIGERRLHQWLRDNGYLIKKPGKDYGKPTQRAMQQGLFEISETTINHNSGVITTKTTARITGKGQIHFLNKFKALLAKAKAELIDFGDAKALRGGAAQ